MKDLFWQKDKTEYLIDDEYKLAKANSKNFSLYYSIYSREDRFIHIDRQEIREDLEEWESCFFLYRRGIIAGGVCIKPNHISNAFFIPPFENNSEVFELYRKLLLHWSDKAMDIYALDIKKSHWQYYERLGFEIDEVRKAMIVPTCKYSISIPSGYKLRVLDKSLKDKMLELYDKAYIGEPDPMSHEENLEEVKDYFDSYENKSDVFTASSVIEHIDSGKIVGACLITLWHGQPLVEDIAVSKEHRKSGLGTLMLKHAINTLYENMYVILRLVVTAGKRAENTYRNLGFTAGVPFATMKIKKEKF